MPAKWGDIVDDELGSAPSTNRTLSGVIQEVCSPVILHLAGPAAAEAAFLVAPIHHLHLKDLLLQQQAAFVASSAVAHIIK